MAKAKAVKEEQQELIPKEEFTIAAYCPLAAQLAEIEAENSTLVFDYASKTGNKEARSHIYKLRQTKTRIDEVRKAEKQEYLERGRRIDSEAKSLTERVEAMIRVHLEPIEAIEQAETQRVAAIQEKLQALTVTLDDIAGKTSTELEAIREGVRLVATSEYSFQEFEDQAAEKVAASMQLLAEAISNRKTLEEQQAEIDRLNREKAEEEAARQEAERQRLAEEEANRKAQERIEEERRQRIIAEERLENERKQAEAAAEQARIDAEQAIRDAEDRAARQQEDQRLAEERAEAERQANREHVGKINKAAATAFQEAGFTFDDAKKVVILIAQGKVPNIKISY